MLGIKDLEEVLNTLRKHKFNNVNYFNLGLSLGLLYTTINTIKGQCREDPESCLRECLAKWLEKADDVMKKGGPTIKSLMAALKELNQIAVADEIHEESK